MYETGEVNIIMHTSYQSNPVNSCYFLWHWFSCKWRKSNNQEKNLFDLYKPYILKDEACKHYSWNY
jgi:hypothetical protein